MKAIRVQEPGEPDVMKMEEVADPTPEAGQIVVKINAVGVNPVDTYIRLGKQGYAPTCPYTPGMDAAGIVEAVGAGVTGVAVGDRVYCAGTLSGAYAEKVLCDQSQVYRLPDRILFQQGAALGVPYGTAYRALFLRAEAHPGETVLIHGASGGVGVAAVQLARAAGLTVIGTAGTPEGRKLLAAQGAHHVVNHHEPEHLQQVMDVTGGQGVNVILEMLANVNLGHDLPILAQDGRVVVIGSRGDVQITPRFLMKKDASILGMSLMNASKPVLASIHAALIAGLENGSLQPVIGRELPLSEAPQAHRLIMEASAFGKIVLIP